MKFKNRQNGFRKQKSERNFGWVAGAEELVAKLQKGPTGVVGTSSLSVVTQGHTCFETH